jgi:enediyne biosynthesis protein E4
MPKKPLVVATGLALLLIAGLVAARRKEPAPLLPSPSPGTAATTAAPPSSTAWFQDRAQQLGVKYRLGHSGRSPLPVLDLMGTGCAVLDYDTDGHADIFLVGQKGVGDTGKCALFHNKGDGTFENVTSGSGLEEPGMYMGCAVGDVDNDGLPDILVTGYGVVKLFRNAGKGKFTDVTKGSGLEAPSPIAWATSAGFSDVDRDGKLDLYIGRYVIFNDKSLQFCEYGAIQAACGPLFYDPQLGSFYRNVGGGRFQDVTRQFGLDAPHGKCLGVTFADVNQDGWPDLYLGNDEMPGDLYINDQGKKFHEEGGVAGVALSADGTMQGAMGVDFADYDRDGRLDLFVTTYQGEPFSLYHNSGPAPGLAGCGFQNRSIQVGMDQPSRQPVGFGTKFVDVDNDGWVDLPVVNGHVHDNQEAIDKLTRYKQPLHLFMNQQGTSFVDKANEAGSGFTTPAVGRGLSTGDLNSDGRPDIVMTDLEGATRVLMNDIPLRGKWLRISLQGVKSNRFGIGAVVTVVAGDKTWIAEVTTGGSYLSASDPRLHFGLGDAQKVDRVQVVWPSGARTTVTAPKIPGDLRIKES